MATARCEQQPDAFGVDATSGRQRPFAVARTSEGRPPAKNGAPLYPTGTDAENTSMPIVLGYPQHTAPRRGKGQRTLVGHSDAPRGIRPAKAGAA
jgi:hypothetical protein